ncbi:MAG: prolipoprotein diacylglyceryl transferase [Nitrospirae bacterium]|nr:prolipoprotein diacylglyceryl transferase [Nitrospirota bacterium]
MIPYLEVPPLSLGPITIQPFGALVITGCFVGYFVSRWYAGQLGLMRNDFTYLVSLVLAAGFILSHLVDMALYYPEELLLHPLSLLSVGSSMSSYGGFIGAAAGAIIYLKRKGRPVLPYSDALVMGLAAGWFFGRMGCSITHDHPGLPSDFFLAVQYPDMPRHDLGLYEWLFTIFLLIFLFSIRAWRLPPGSLTGILCVLYAPVRFMLDFLRVGDRLYLGFTPGQYFSVLFFGIGLWLLTKSVTLRGEKRS